jgi:two-component system, NarL family, nitrate/nitrite response regulator NarL
MVSEAPPTNGDGSEEFVRRRAAGETTSVEPSARSFNRRKNATDANRGRKSVSTTVEERPEPIRIPVRILVVGSDLLAGALASALASYGFATKHIVARASEVEDGIRWRPNLVLIDVRFLDVISGSELIGQMHQVGLPICVIDSAGDNDRLNSWTEAGTSAFIDGKEPFDQLFRTINRLLQDVALPELARGSPTSLTTAYAAQPRQASHQRLFCALTEREQVVLAELMEGHCAEEIANRAFVSISTVRSQIKAILQKLGVNSQLAAVAKARRAGWSLESQPHIPPKPLGREASPPGVA